MRRFAAAFIAAVAMSTVLAAPARADDYVAPFDEADGLAVAATGQVVALVAGPVREGGAVGISRSLAPGVYEVGVRYAIAGAVTNASFRRRILFGGQAGDARSDGTAGVHETYAVFHHGGGSTNVLLEVQPVAASTSGFGAVGVEVLVISVTRR